MELKRRGRANQPILSSYGESRPKEKRLRLWGDFHAKDGTEALAWQLNLE
jgi:hypothetical protein